MEFSVAFFDDKRKGHGSLCETLGLLRNKERFKDFGLYK